MFANATLPFCSKQLSPTSRSKRMPQGRTIPPMGPETKVYVVWVERYDDIGMYNFLVFTKVTTGQEPEEKLFLFFFFKCWIMEPQTSLNWKAP